jgi:hypothetical protein
MPKPAKWVFVSLSTCGHAQSVYGDVPSAPCDKSILEDLRAGLTVWRIPLEEWSRRYVRKFMCGCPCVGHENENSLAKAQREVRPKGGMPHA